MKKLLLLLFLSILSVNSVYAYTEKEGQIEFGFDERVKNERGREISLDSTTFFPTGFLDGTTIQEAPVQPIGAGRTHWDDKIDFNKFNCNTASGDALFNKKCFLRHSGVFTKIDISKDADLSGQTNYPSLNNVMVAEVDARYDENFSFGVAGFGVSSQGGIAQGGLQGGPGAEIWNSSHNAKQGAAIQVFAMDKDGNEITDGNGFPIGFPITVNGEDITEKVGERNVVTSLNRKLFRGYCLKNGVEDYSMLASDPNCKVAWNMIFSLTPKMEVNKDLFRKPQSLSERDLGKTKISTYKIGVRIFPIVIGDDGKYYEPSYVADERMGKLAYADTSRYGITNIHNLVDVNGTKKGTVIEQSNYLAFATNSVVKDDGLYVPKTNFNQILSVLKKNGDDQKRQGEGISPFSSEFLNYYGNFVTHQIRGSKLHFGSYYGISEAEKNSYVARSTLGNEVGTSGNGVTSKYFQSENFFREGKLTKGTKEIVLFTMDFDNKTSSLSGPETHTAIGFANLGSKDDIIKVQKRDDIDEFVRNTLLTEAFDRWREGGTTSAYISDIKPVSGTRDLSPIGELFYGRNGKKLIPFLKNQAEVDAFNNGLTDKAREVDGVSKMITMGNNFGKDTANGYSYVNQDSNLKYKDKGFNWSGGGFSSFSIQDEGDATMNGNTDADINISSFRHGQGNIEITNLFSGFGKNGFGITKIPVSALFNTKETREKYLECETENDCKMKEDYVFRFFISKSVTTNAIGYTLSTDHHIDGDNEEEKELVPIDLGLKMNQLCTFRKAVADTDPSQAYYKLLNADKSCKDIVVKHLFSATQDQGTDAFNQAWTIKEEPLENPTEPLQPGQRATMEVNHTNVCDLAFVGKVIASNTDILQRDIKDLKLRISSIPKNVEMLDAADINVGDKSVKFKSKPKGSDMNVENPILNMLGLLPGEDTKKVQGDFIIQACNGDIYRTPLNGDSDEQELYLKLEADSNAWAKSKGSKVCQYAFEYAFRPLAPQCSAIDTNTYGTDDSGEITVGKVKNGEPTTFKYPEDGSNRVVKDYEGFTSKSGEMAKYLTFTDMRIGNFGFCFELIKNTGNKL